MRFMPMIASSFRPPWWLRNGHLQTLWPTFAPRRLALSLTDERLSLADGDFLDLSWVGRPLSPNRDPIVLVLHGLEGSVASPYAKGMLAAVREQGWAGVVMHFRGCSGIPNRLPRCYHSGETEDLTHVLHYLAERFPHTPLAAVGYSLGGNVLLKYLGEVGADTPLRAAVAVSPPLQLASCAARLEQGFSQLYQRHLLSRMKRNLRRKMKTVAMDDRLLVDARGVDKLDTFRRYDDAVTAPLHGFLDADDYYARSSGIHFLPRISIPTLLLHAADDPFMGPDVIPEPDQLAEAVAYELSEWGGHVGFYGHTGQGVPRFWLEQRIPEYLAPHLG